MTSIQSKNIDRHLPDHGTLHLVHPKYRADIDGLRAIAVLSVVCFHAFPGLLKGGFAGVDIFFVISGFLISTIILQSMERNRFSFLEFYGRRVRRIFPTLLLVLIACYAFGWIELLADEYKQLGKHLLGGAGFVSNFLLWNESGYFDSAAESKPLLHLWSLGIEEQFYILWPLLMWFGFKKRFNLLTIIIVVSASSFLWNITQVHADATASFYSPQTRFWELLCGSLLAWMTLFKPDRFAGFKHKLDGLLGAIVYAQAPQANGATLRDVQSIFGAALIFSGILFITKEQAFPGWWAMLPVAGAALVISAGAQAWFNRTILSHRILVWLGLISFPLYLWHWPILSYARIVEGGLPSIEIRIAAIVAAIVLAWLTYKLIEKPLRFGGHHKAKVTLLIFLMAMVGFVGYNTYRRDGLAFRLPKEFSDIDFEYHKNVRSNICHIENTESSVFNPACMEQGKPSLAIWGDSHASALYPGLKKLQDEKHFGITQLTAAACPPIFDLEKLNYKKDCNANNESIFNALQGAKPDVLLLHAAWFHEGYPMSLEQLKRQVEKSLQKIKGALPTTRIVMIGPMPRWGSSPKKVAFAKWKKDILHTEKLGSVEKAVRLDDIEGVLRDIAARNNATYISALGSFCSAAGCTSRLGDNADDWVAIDDGHLSKKGSEFFIGTIKDRIF